MIEVLRSSHELDSRLESQCLAAFDQVIGQKDLGFHQLTLREANWSSTLEVSERLLSSFEDFVFVGIGGSGLGGKTIQNCFLHRPESDHVFFLENVDSYSLDAVFRKINLEKTAFVFVSKSGTTLETLAIANEILDRLKRHRDDLTLQSRSVVITEDKASPLFDWGKSIKAEFLEIPVDVGGRFSVLTPVGLLVGALMRLDLEKMRQGAAWSVKQRELVASLCAYSLQSFQREEWVTQFWIYSDRLGVFGSWLQQLWAESLAKRVDGSGARAQRVSTPMGCIGAIDQHSLLQQVMDGARDKWIFGLSVEPEKSSGPKNQFSSQTYLDNSSLQAILNAEKVATFQAMSDEGVSTLEISITHLDEKSLAALFMLFQLVVGTIGVAININAFDQPGVEKGKVLAKNLLSKSQN